MLSANVVSTHYYNYTDVRTQADYQQMDPNFVGLIFSCFSETEKVHVEVEYIGIKLTYLFQRCNLQVICFQSVTGDQG